MSKIILLTYGIIVILALPTFGQGVISDPGFESGTFVPGGTGGWDSLSGSPAFAQDNTHSGAWSLKASLAIGSAICLAHQWVAVEPGTQYQLTGWGLTPARLATTVEGYITFNFADANHVHISSGYFSLKITSGSPLATWIPLSASATAPANAAFAEITAGVASLVQPFGNNSVYFDDMNLAAVPEPSSLGLMATSFLACHLIRKRQRRV
jgi:PEP-CTERM motif